MFDIGELHTLSSRDLLKVTHLFVTHTHMDHFIGFDNLIRIFLGREKELHLFGRWVDVAHSVDQPPSLTANPLHHAIRCMARRRNTKGSRQIEIDIAVHIPDVGPLGFLPEHWRIRREVGDVSTLHM